MNIPPWWRAKSQLNRAVRTPPMWRAPVGLGAKRTLTGVWVLIYALGSLYMRQFSAVRSHYSKLSDESKVNLMFLLFAHSWFHGLKENNRMRIVSLAVVFLEKKGLFLTKRNALDMI
jgi:hypothetical protein